MLQLAAVTVRLAGRVILQDASFRVPERGKIGLVGRNGSGKSTILRLIAEQLAPDQGEVELRRGVRVGSVAQEAPGGAQTPVEAVLAAQKERAELLRRAGTATDAYDIAEIQTRLADIRADRTPVLAAAILKGLGFSEAMQAQPLSSFSGGWRMRVALAAVLCAEPDLLLLDEPTNHLDFEAATWLIGYLQRYPRAMLLVSHDRDLLDEVPEQIVHLHGGRTETYSGNYSRFARTRAERLVLQEKERKKQDERRAHLQSFVDRFRYKASKAKQAQARLKMLERMAPISAAVHDPEVVFNFPATEPPAPPLLTLDHTSVGYDEQPILRDISLRLDPDDRIALLGANGNGKSTLAKLIAGKLDPLTGEVVRAKGLRVGFFAQHQIEDLRPEQNALQHLAAVLPERTPQQLRQRLAQYGLGAEKVETPAKRLSGGEKARLTFALMTVHAPHVLILDEPTNHLDIDSRDALIEAVNDFAGAVILISHDRHLLELTADRLWLVADSKVTPWRDSLAEYRDYLMAQGKALDEAPDDKPTLEVHATVETNGAGVQRAAAAKPAKIDSATRRSKVAPLRQSAKAAEREVERLGAEKAALDARIADPATYNGAGEDVAALMQRAAELEARLADAEARWLEAEEALEAAQA